MIAAVDLAALWVGRVLLAMFGLLGTIALAGALALSLCTASWWLFKGAHQQFRNTGFMAHFAVWYWTRRGDLDAAENMRDRLRDHERVNTLTTALQLLMAAHLQNDQYKTFYSVEEAIAVAQDALDETGAQPPLEGSSFHYDG